MSDQQGETFEMYRKKFEFDFEKGMIRLALRLYPTQWVRDMYSFDTKKFKPIDVKLPDQ